ncbi:uncharacterized protein RAG0_05333 [Rhynchosporium agropyri]|uniref:Uncharacterized protein n=1 Tax=Rhynchosporium agropyri TaxID=914238 RepID=A0A1E1KCQ2_9HELO|nr:uncharacterized protein RAG0_05333 [Rhynchosporium agropyri]
MTRHGKQKVTIDLESSDEEPAPSVLPEAPSVKKKQKMQGKKIDKRFKIAKRVMPDAPEESDQDELGVDQRVVLKSGRMNFQPVDAGREKEVLRAVGKAAKILLALGDQVDLKTTIQSVASRNDLASNKIREDCAIISKLLPFPISASAQQPHGEVPSTIHLYDQYFVHQGAGRQMFVLRPVEAFQGNVNLTRRKVMGFVQHKGSNFPLKYALPGWTPAAEDHPNLLNSGFWTKEVQRWGEFHNHHFPTHPFDEYHGKVKGHACASHVEPRLMLWFACDRLRELRGVDKPIRTLLGELFRLRDYDIKMEAEIHLTRDPCRKCLEIRDLIEEYTRIKFHFKSARTLGELQLEKNKHGWVTFGRYAQVDSDEEDEDFEVVERQEVVKETKSTFAVVIRGQPSTPTKQKSKSHAQELTPPSSSSTVTKISTKTQKNHIRSFSYQPCRSLSTTDLHQPEIESDSDTSDYRPRTKVSRKSKSTPSPLESPDQDEDDDLHGSAESSVGPFGLEAQRQAKLLKRGRKRRAEQNASPSQSKKARRTKV